MALSFCSNWRGELEQFNSETTMFAQTQAELSPELVSFNPNLSFSDLYIDHLLESHDLFYSDHYISLLPAYLSYPSANSSNDLCSLIPEVFQEVEYEPYPYLNPKCQKEFEGCYNNGEIVAPGLCNGFVPNPSLFQEPTPEILSPFPASFASNPPVFSRGRSSTETMKKSSNGGTSSAQSIAARRRRRKITEKTQELGKLIPGGHKMNTAEMFQAAFKYIKFLQAQVGIFKTWDSAAQENGESFQNQELNPLLGSYLIQEKLYSMEKCLVPNKFVQSLENDNRLQSNTQAFQEFQEMIGHGS